MSILTKGKKRGLLLYIIVLIVLGTITEIVPEVTGALTKTEILEYENMQITDEVVCYFVRNETVHLAPNSGSINYYIEDGVKVRKNAKILDITPQLLSSDTSIYTDIMTRLKTTNVTLTQMNSEQKGIVSYYVDGYEGYFTPDKMDTLQYKDIEGVRIQPVNLTRKNTLVGEPLFKICEGDYWYMVAWVNPGNISKYEVGNTVKVDLPLAQIKANVERLVDQGDRWLVVMKTTRYYQDFARIRSANATIITQDYSGIKIRNSSITTQNGVAGVYIKSTNREFVFRPVKIITSDGNYSLVYVSNFYDEDRKKIKTVKIYDEILKNPVKDFRNTEDINKSEEVS